MGSLAQTRNPPPGLGPASTLPPRIACPLLDPDESPSTTLDRREGGLRRTRRWGIVEHLDLDGSRRPVDAHLDRYDTACFITLVRDS